VLRAGHRPGALIVTGMLAVQLASLCALIWACKLVPGTGSRAAARQRSLAPAVQGADFVEGDTVLTKDGHLVLRHEVTMRWCSASRSSVVHAARWCSTHSTVK
jgi:Glycerophosphoryl diester phosphodiesterase family